MKIFYYLVLLLLFATANVHAQTGNWKEHTEAFVASDSKGDSEENPIEISTAGQLSMLAKLVNEGNSFSGKFFKLTVDLNLEAHEWTAIGVRANDDTGAEFRPFNGTFDGDGHTISNMTLHNMDYDNGLFSTIDAEAVVKNLKIVNSSLTGRNGVGAVVASNFGTVVNCSSSGTVAGRHHVGVLVGFNNPGATVSNCYATGVSIGSGNNIGGLVGFNDVGATIANCYSTGSVKGEIWVGGLVGINNGNITNSYATGNVTGEIGIGGLAGINGYDGENTISTNATIAHCYAAGNVTGVDPDSIGGFIGTNRSPIAILTSYFDSQGTGQLVGIGYDINNQGKHVVGINTVAFAIDNLPDGLNATVWQSSAGYYPQLKVFGNNDNNKAWSALSVVPITLANTQERSDSVCTTFRLAAQTSLGEDITWKVAPGKTAFIGNRWVSSINEKKWDTLTLAVDDRSRIMVYRPETKFSDANILAYEIGSVRYENPDQQTRIPVDCSYTGSQIAVKVITNPFATIVPGTNLQIDVSRPGTSIQDITVTSVDRKITQPYELTMERLFANNIFLQRWNDVLAVINNPANNGGYTFTAYEWYKNGNKLSTTGGYLQEPGGLDKSAAYTAMLTTSTGEQIATCPAVISDVQIKLAAYPNPAARGQVVRVETNIPPEAGKAIIKLFDQMGNTIKTMVVSDVIMEIAMPSIAGQYLLQVATGNNISQTFKIIVE